MTGVPLPLAVAALLLGVLLLALSLRALLASARGRRDGTLVSVDRAGEGTSLTSAGLRLVGRPDALRRLPDGRYIPVELKRRPAPRSGPLPSHQVQVAAYCLLVEETTGVPPPYGVLRYGDGVEFRLPWDAARRHDLLELRARLRRPYDGRATPSPAKCRHCGWREQCDARA